MTLIIFKRELHTVSSHIITDHLFSFFFPVVPDHDIFLFFCLQISFLGGLVTNEGVNWLIKNIVREPRPCEGELLCDEGPLPQVHLCGKGLLNEICRRC